MATAATVHVEGGAQPGASPRNGSSNGIDLEEGIQAVVKEGLLARREARDGKAGACRPTSDSGILGGGRRKGLS